MALEFSHLLGAKSLYDCFQIVNGSNLFEALIELCTVAREHKRPTSFGEPRRDHGAAKRASGYNQIRRAYGSVSVSVPGNDWSLTSWGDCR
jgi:hypothetical protein